MPLMEALALRRSTREFDVHPLPLQHLSNVLWAAHGINRPVSGDHTAPTWRHIGAMDVYVAMQDGLYRYSPELQQLLPHRPMDLRTRTGSQDFVGVAPVDLIYVAHGDLLSDLDAHERRPVASVDAAFMGQNVYLYCAANGLATVFRGALDHSALEEAMALSVGQFVTFAQTVGYPRHSPGCPKSVA
jgi:nitroreductase